jgi:arylsulfatase A-like enzyme
MNSPDILFIVLDTQRADRLGCYGHSKAITPNLDHFANQGTLFEQAVSPAQWTIPSHASLFTGLYPTAHGVTQSSQSLNNSRPHLAEVLQTLGYETVGFCNNPLVGVLDNGFKRGFQAFYNYGGAFPSVPHHSNPWPWPLNHIAEGYTQFLRRISYPVQNFFGQSDLAFRISLHAWLTPVWSRMANFKGQNERSVQDVVRFLSERETHRSEKPLFLFLNLMETHLPFWPPGEFIDQVAPYFRHNKEARTILRTWNREAYRWAAPLAEPMSELEDQVLNDLYDAEVAYQDYYLGQLFNLLDHRSRQKDTLTVIVADHGDGLGDHGYFGHAFVAYQELVHVPLILQWPDRIPESARIDTPVSTRRVYHTMLDAAIRTPEQSELIDALLGTEASTIRRLALRHTISGRDPEQQTAFSEVYPPLNFVKAIETRQPDLLNQFRCLATRRAVVRDTRLQDGQSDQTAMKLIAVDDMPDELFDLANDPFELDEIGDKNPVMVAGLTRQLEQMVQRVRREHESLPAGELVELEGDDFLHRRLRGLGYLE